MKLHPEGAERWYKLPGGRAVGLLDQVRRTYRTYRHHKTHFAFTRNGYGIQQVVVRELEALRVETVLLDEERASGTVYRCPVPLRRFLDSRNRGVLREEDGEQVFVSLAALGRGTPLGPVADYRAGTYRRPDPATLGEAAACVPVQQEMGVMFCATHGHRMAGPPFVRCVGRGEPRNGL